MAKHDTDPVLAHLVRAVDESGRSAVPVTVAAHGMTLTGFLIAQDAYFAGLAEGMPMMSALQPTSGLLGKEYAREVTAESGHHLHLRTAHGDGDGENLWRISVQAVDAWTLGAPAGTSTPGDSGQDDRGPFARLLGA